MGIWAAAVLAAALAQESDALPRTMKIEDEASPADGLLTARLGVWTGRSFKFEAIRPDGTQASTREQAFFSASLMGGVQFYEHLVLMGSFESSFASQITIQTGGAYLGYRDHPKTRYGNGVPDEVMLYAGVVTGRITVHEDDFGSFERGVGLGAGLEFGWSLSPRVIVALWAEYRSIKFDYKPEVLSGDDRIGGSSGWFGVGLDWRF